MPPGGQLHNSLILKQTRNVTAWLQGLKDQSWWTGHLLWTEVIKIHTPVKCIRRINWRSYYNFHAPQCILAFDLSSAIECMIFAQMGEAVKKIAAKKFRYSLSGYDAVHIWACAPCSVPSPSVDIARKFHNGIAAIDGDATNKRFQQQSLSEAGCIAWNSNV